MSEMREFWDARADEDAYYFVDNRLEYGAPDLERFWSSGPELLEQILDSLGAAIEPGDDAVEIGCGVGRVTRALAAQATSVRAIDVSERMLALAREHNSELDNVTWILGDGTSLAPIEDTSADVCFSHVVFQHIPDPAVTLGYVREMGRILHPGGWSGFQISNAPEIHRRPSVVGRARGWWRDLWGRGPRGQDDRAWRGSAIELTELERTANQAELEVERLVGVGTQFCFVLLRRRAAQEATSS